MRMRRLKVCPNDRASTTWDYAGLPGNIYRDAGPKRCQHSQTYRAQSTFKPFYKWCNMLLPFPCSYHFSLPPWHSSILPLHLPISFPPLCARELGAIIIITPLYINYFVMKTIKWVRNKSKLYISGKKWFYFQLCIISISYFSEFD